jgi:hypothetical protein
MNTSERSLSKKGEQALKVDEWKRALIMGCYLHLFKNIKSRQLIKKTKQL